MKISKSMFGILLLFVMFLATNIFPFSNYGMTVLAKQENIELYQSAILSFDEQEILDLINEYREQNGLQDLKSSSKLQEAARIKAEDLVNNNYFAHTSDKLGTPFEMLQNNGIDYIIAGENLAGNVSPEKAVEAWINSPSHKENILQSRFEYTGIYVINSPTYGKVFVQLFIGV